MASSPWSEAPAAERYAVDFENGPRITIENYNPRWADYFQSIKSDIESDLSDEKITYQSIEHIGSTSVPGLASKAITDPSSDIFRQSIIDICIIVAKEEFTAAKLGQFREALLWGKRQGESFSTSSTGALLRHLLPLLVAVFWLQFVQRPVFAPWED